MRLDKQAVRDFQETVWRYYDLHGRSALPWRQPEPDGSFSPYKIMVSEVMLQQTRVSRVMPKYESFLAAFPSMADLARSELKEVLLQWSGLGYNRRAKYVWLAARAVMENYDGAMPNTVAKLQQLPGIGYNTASAIYVYAYNKPAMFIETNIRTVYIHHFFGDRTDVHDKEILEIMPETLPEEHQYREWYWALMDYGTHLKATVGNLNKASSHYSKQSRFEGSLRQLRGQILRVLAREPQTKHELENQLSDSRLDVALGQLYTEGMIQITAEKYHL